MTERPNNLPESNAVPQSGGASEVPHMDSIRPSERDAAHFKVDLQHGPDGPPAGVVEEHTGGDDRKSTRIAIDDSTQASPAGRRLLGGHPVRRLLAVVVVLLVTSGLGFGAYVYGVANNQIVDGESSVGLLGQIQRIVDEDVEPLQGEEEDRINIALLGRGGLDHPGGTLIDTIMVASIKPSTGQAALVSLPRDLVIPFTAEGTSYLEYRKINYVTELGGTDFALETLQNVTGLEMHYYVLADFKGFRDVIDTLGGLEIEIDNSFVDSQYPDYNYGYQTITFTEGVEVMEGERALQYARSRHGNNGEGSDFARAARQQKILEGLRNKALSASTFLNPTKVTGLLNDVGENVSTNIEIWEMARFAELAQDINAETVINKVVDNGLNGLVYSEISSETGAYVLIPRAGLGDFSEIESLAVNIFGTADVVEEQAVVAVQNGTTIEGLAGRTASVLEGAGVVIDGITNAAVNTVPNTVVYQLTDNDVDSTKSILEEQLGVTVARATRPAPSETGVRLGTDLDGALVDLETLPDAVDFVIVLGRDQDRLNTIDPLL